MISPPTLAEDSKHYMGCQDGEQPAAHGFQLSADVNINN
jgi:hypothetical protein